MADKKEAKEEWRDIPNYEGYYQASNLGRVRSLNRATVDSRGGRRFYKGRIVDGIVREGYRQATLTKNGVGRCYMFSQLVAMAFLGHKPNGNGMVVDHVDGNKSSDRADNLRIVTHRANISTCFRSDKDSLSSNNAGVSWKKCNSKWQAAIVFNGKKIYLGLFDDEGEASIAYQSVLSKIKEGSFNPNDYKPKFTSKYKGVSFHNRHKKWQAQISIDGKSKHVGYFPTELEAHQAYQDKLKELDNNTNNK